MPIYASIVLKMHNNAHPTYIHTYIHIITHITHVVNTYKYNYMKIPHKFGHIRVNFLQSVRLQVTSRKGSPSVPGSPMVNLMCGSMELRCS